jgi:hypothetical protein
MFWVLVGLVIIFAVAMIFVAVTPSRKVVTRDDFLSQLEKYTEGRRTPIPELADSYRLDFDFEGHHFWYEDIQSEGFTQKVYKGLLRIQSNSDLNLIFVKKDRNKLLGGDLQMMSNISDSSVNKQNKVFTPVELKEFDIFTQTPYKVNLFLEDKKARSVLAKIKQFDRQGEPLMPISISDGVICLEFSLDDRVKLNRQALLESPQMMEGLADGLIVLVKALNKAHQTT